MNDYCSMIDDYLKLEAEVLGRLDREAISKAMNLLDETRLKGKKTYIFGNGGSSATASHFQNDFNKGISEYLYKKGEPKFRFCCLNDNIPTMMAIANDIGFEEIFRFQLQGNLEEGDIVVGITGSGNSKNVLNAVEYAKSCGNKVIGITGYKGGKLKDMADILLCSDINSMQITEDVHMIYDHLIMSIFYKTLAGKNHVS